MKNKDKNHRVSNILSGKKAAPVNFYAVAGILNEVKDLHRQPACSKPLYFDEYWTPLFMRLTKEKHQSRRAAFIGTPAREKK